MVVLLIVLIILAKEAKKGIVTMIADIEQIWLLYYACLTSYSQTYIMTHSFSMVIYIIIIFLSSSTLVAAEKQFVC